MLLHVGQHGLAENTFRSLWGSHHEEKLLIRSEIDSLMYSSSDLVEEYIDLKE